MAGSYEFSDENQDKIITIAITVSTISLIGSFFIISLFALFKKLRSFPFRYVCFLSIADVINSIGFLLNSHGSDEEEKDDKFICKLQSFMINYGELSSILWTTVIAWLLYQQIIVQRIQDVGIYEKRMFLYAYLMPLLLSIIPFITGDYGSAGGWCWISQDNGRVRSTIIRFIEFYIPLWIAFVYNCVTIYKVVKFVEEKTTDKRDRQLVNKLKYYPLLLVFCWSFGSIDRICNLFGVESMTLHILNFTFGGLQGFANALVYGLSKKVRGILVENCPCGGSDEQKSEADPMRQSQNFVDDQNFQQQRYNRSDSNRENNTENNNSSMQQSTKGKPQDLINQQDIQLQMQKQQQD